MCGDWLGGWTNLIATADWSADGGRVPSAAASRGWLLFRMADQQGSLGQSPRVMAVEVGAARDAWFHTPALGATLRRPGNGLLGACQACSERWVRTCDEFRLERIVRSGGSFRESATPMPRSGLGRVCMVTAGAYGPVAARLSMFAREIMYCRISSVSPLFKSSAKLSIPRSNNKPPRTISSKASWTAPLMIRKSALR